MAPPIPPDRIPGSPPHPGPIPKPGPRRPKADVVVSFDQELPADADLARAKLTPEAISLVKELYAHRADLAATLAADRQFAADFARDPVAAASAAGWISAASAPTSSSSPLTSDAGVVRFAIPATSHGRVVPVGRNPGELFLDPDAVERAMLNQTLAQAQASPATWAAFGTDPSILVHQVAATWDWRLLRGGAQAGAAITQDLIDALRATFAGQSSVGTGASGQSTEATTVVAAMSEG